MAKYPIYLELGGRRVVIIGAGAVAARKAQPLLAAGARVVVVAEKVDDIPAGPATANNLELIKSKYSKDYLAGAQLAIAATNKPSLNRRIYKDCQQLEILCNVVDQPELCDFFVPAVVKRGGLRITIGTDGYCPAYAGHLRKKLEKIFTEEHGRFLSELEPLRKDIIKNVPDLTSRRALLGRLVDDESFEYFVQNEPAQWRKRAEKIVKEYQQQGS